MKLGIHAYAWCSPCAPMELDLIDRTQNLGLDFIDIPLALKAIHPAAVKERLRQTGMAALASINLSAETDITSDEPAVRNAGTRYLKDNIQKAARMGASIVSGIIYSAHMKAPARRPVKSHYQYAADCLRDAAAYAAGEGVTLCLRPVNRYETCMVNTCEQALKLIRVIGADNVKLHLDTFHMSIEEKDYYEAFKAAGNDLVYIYFNENDRGIPGTGLTDWEGVFRALTEMNYSGYAAIESFADITENSNTWIWRQLAPSGDDLLKDGIAFIRKMMDRFEMSPLM